MFQNISNNINEEIDNKFDKNEEVSLNNSAEILKQIFSIQNIIIYFVSFMMSTVGFGENYTPFALAILASACSNYIPVGIIYFCTSIGTLIGFGKNNLLIYILTSLFFILSTLILKNKIYNNMGDRKKVLTKKLFFITLVMQIVSKMSNGLLIYELLESIMFTILTCTFYKIFTSSITVIRDFKIRQAFSIEEVIGASLMIAIAFSALGTIEIFGFNIRNILCILIVLIMGWKNGMLVGATTGITIGVVLGTICLNEPIMIAAYALSGMVSGILNKLGKIGVVVGFITGNAIITYILNGNTSTVIIFKEILIASIGLLAIPKTVNINIEDFYGKSKLLPKAPENALNGNICAAYKLNGVSEVVSEISKTYKEVAATVVEDEDLIETCKITFINEIRNSLEPLEENILYEDMMEPDDEIIEELLGELIEKEKINKEILLQILEKHNNYIIGFDDPDISVKLNNDIDDIVRIINTSYRVSNINMIYKKKENISKNILSDQLKDVSKVISNIAEDITKNTENKQLLDKKNKIKRKLDQEEIHIRNIIIKEENNRYFIEIEVDTNETMFNSVVKEKILSIVSNILEIDITIQKENNNGYIRLIEKDKYFLKLGIAKKNKEGSEISGDSSIQLKLDDGKYLIGLSDGMGSGKKAKESSLKALNLLKKLFKSGFDKESSIDLINSTILIGSEKETFATLDITILDLFNGNVEFIKNGACPTFVKNKKNVNILDISSLPSGIMSNNKTDIYDRDIENNDILVICSDGVLDSNSEYNNKELWLKYLLEEIDTEDPKKIADIILSEAIDNGYGIAKDDMTVITIKIIKNDI